jgi:hypothetical protein
MEWELPATQVRVCVVVNVVPSIVNDLPAGFVPTVTDTLKLALSLIGAFMVIDAGLFAPE